MKRPEKRKLEQGSIYLQYDKGYNHAHGDYEKFLPSEEEITKLISKDIKDIGNLLGRSLTEFESNLIRIKIIIITKAIRKRLEGK